MSLKLAFPSARRIPKHVKNSSKRSTIVRVLPLILVSMSLALGQSSPSVAVGGASAERLTLQLSALHRQYLAAASGKSQALSRLQAVARTRQQVLTALMESDPGGVLRVAVPASLRAGLPAAVQSSIEQRVQLQGKLEVLYEDSHTSARLRHFLEVGGQRLELKFAQNPPTHLLTGAIVRVQGVQLEQKVAVASGTSSTSLQTVSNAPMPNAMGAQNTLVVLVNFQNNTAQPYT